MMKINREYILREVAGEAMAVPTGKAVSRHNGIFLLSETGAFLWRLIEDGIPPEKLSERLTEEFEVSREQAQADTDEFIKSLTELGIIVTE